MTDYAMRLLMYVAHQNERLCTIAEIAAAYQISEAHLMKITHQLAQGGFLETVRGKGGGMRLAQEPAAINLGAVVRYIESDFAVVECFTGHNVCSLTGHCKLAGILSGAMNSFLDHLDRHTLADVLQERVPTLRTVTLAPAVARKVKTPGTTGATSSKRARG